MNGDRVRGTVRWWSTLKNYGFIEVAGAGERDVFVHADALPDGVPLLREGQRVTLEVEQHQSGPRAKQVRVSENV